MYKARLAALGVILFSQIALQSCTPQAKFVPSARNHWRVFCESPPTLFFDIFASYTEALNSHVCDQNGGVRKVWDLDLTKSGWVAPTNFGVRDLADPAAVDRAARQSRGFPTRAVAAAPQPFCAAATCQSSGFQQYIVTYMGTFHPSHNWFNCQTVGLYNIPKSATNVYGAANGIAPEVCPIGIKPRFGSATTGTKSN